MSTPYSVKFLFPKVFDKNHKRFEKLSQNVHKFTNLFKNKDVYGHDADKSFPLTSTYLCKML